MYSTCRAKPRRFQSELCMHAREPFPRRILIPTREGGPGGLTPPGPHGRDERDLRRATADGRAPSEGWAFASQTARVLDAAKALRTSLRAATQRCAQKLLDKTLDSCSGVGNALTRCLLRNHGTGLAMVRLARLIVLGRLSSAFWHRDRTAPSLQGRSGEFT